METVLKRGIPFLVAAGLVAVGVYGLQLNWALAALGFERLPGLADAQRLNYFLAMLPTALQAYLWVLKKDLTVREFLDRHFYWALGGLVATVFEVVFVRLGLIERELTELAAAGAQAPALTGSENALVLFTAIFICLIAEVLIVSGLLMVAKAAREVLPRKHTEAALR